MTQNKWWTGILLMMLVVALPMVTIAEGAISSGSPTAAIRELDDILDDFRTGPQLTTADREFNVALKRRILHGTFDIRELCRLALGKHWETHSADEQNRFVDLLIQLLEEKALFAKEQSAAKSKSGGKYRVQYEGERYLDQAESRALVRTKVIIPAENLRIALSYRLKRQEKQWKIYDIIVDDASLVDNYRYQFNAIITKNGYPELVNRMTKKLEEIRAKRHSP